MESSKVVYIGLLGLGTVGSGVVKSLASNDSHIEARTGYSVQVRHALVRDIDKPRRVVIDKALLTVNPKTIVEDPAIQIVVEVMGGIEPARSLILQALHAGKHVITANKELLAKHGDDLISVANDMGVRLLFEASVAGGIPIIRMVEAYLTANRIFAIRGILNGTCNYILTQMDERNEPFADALFSAQELGYAEANPESDVEGFDAAYKLSILANMAFPIKSSIGDVVREGITHVTPVDIVVARHMGAVIKLLGFAELREGHIMLRVGPRMISKVDALSSVRDVFNAVTLSADVVGDLTFIGRGAGELPTASAVIEDLMEVLHAPQPRPTRLQLPSVDKSADEDPVPGNYYVRVHIQGKVTGEQFMHEAARVAMAVGGDIVPLVAQHGAISDACVILCNVQENTAREFARSYSPAAWICLPFDAPLPITGKVAILPLERA